MDKVLNLAKPCDQGFYSPGGTLDDTGAVCIPCPPGYTTQTAESTSHYECNGGLCMSSGWGAMEYVLTHNARLLQLVGCLYTTLQAWQQVIPASAKKCLVEEQGHTNNLTVVMGSILLRTCATRKSTSCQQACTGQHVGPRPSAVLWRMHVGIAEKVSPAETAGCSTLSSSTMLSGHWVCAS